MKKVPRMEVVHFLSLLKTFKYENGNSSRQKYTDIKAI